MANKIFTADNPANPIRLIKPKDYDPRVYFYRHFDDDLSEKLIPDFQTKVCYTQKFTKQDSTTIQILSDYEDITCQLYDYDGNVIRNFTAELVNTSVVGYTFKLYEINIFFSSLQDGIYQLRVMHTNDLLQIETYYSEPISIKDVHENTILIEYTNADNEFGLIFDNNFKPKLRVEGAILNFTPSSDDVIYNDQKRNATTLYALPYRSFQLIIGSAKGVPDWMADKVNRAFCFDQVQLDGEYFSKSVDAVFEEVRSGNDYPFSGQTLQIEPTINKFVDSYNSIPGELIPDNPDDIIMYQKLHKITGNTGNLTISGVLKKGSLLEMIVVVNRSISTFDMTIKSSPEDTTFGITDEKATIENVTNTIVINQYFNGDVSLILGGLTDTDTDIYIWYKDTFAPAINIGNGGITNIAVGTISMYEETYAGQKDIDFNFGTGLGREDTAWEGWAICDGRNGTSNMGGRTSVGYLLDSPLFGTLKVTGGSETKTLTVGQLPRHRFFTATPGNQNTTLTGTNSLVQKNTGNPTFNDRYDLKGTVGEPTLGRTNEIGNNEPVNVMQPYLVVLYVKKIS